MFSAKLFLKIGRKSVKYTIKHIYAYFSAQSKLPDCQHLIYCSLGCPEHIGIAGLLSSFKSHSILNPHDMLPDYKREKGRLFLITVGSHFSEVGMTLAIISLSENIPVARDWLIVKDLQFQTWFY